MEEQNFLAPGHHFGIDTTARTAKHDDLINSIREEICEYLKIDKRSGDAVMISFILTKHIALGDLELAPKEMEANEYVPKGDFGRKVTINVPRNQSVVEYLVTVPPLTSTQRKETA
jgi:hypothetical protein